MYFFRVNLCTFVAQKNHAVAFKSVFIRVIRGLPFCIFRVLS